MSQRIKSHFLISNSVHLPAHFTISLVTPTGEWNSHPCREPSLCSRHQLMQRLEHNWSNCKCHNSITPLPPKVRDHWKPVESQGFWKTAAKHCLPDTTELTVLCTVTCTRLDQPTLQHGQGMSQSLPLPGEVGEKWTAMQRGRPHFLGDAALRGCSYCSADPTPMHTRQRGREGWI